jgi:hypothetical protein
VYERVYAMAGGATFLHGSVDEQPVLPSGGAEVFVLRKLLPQTLEYDFNIHVMDFRPGEHLMVKVRGGGGCCFGGAAQGWGGAAGAAAAAATAGRSAALRRRCCNRAAALAHPAL